MNRIKVRHNRSTLVAIRPPNEYYGRRHGDLANSISAVIHIEAVTSSSVGEESFGLRAADTYSSFGRP